MEKKRQIDRKWSRHGSDVQSLIYSGQTLVLMDMYSFKRGHEFYLWY